MPIADLSLPSRLLAGGGPSTPDERVLRALGAPTIGQFDPDFTAIMDDVSALARAVFLTRNARCFAVSGLAAAGLEAFITSLVEDGDTLAIGGGTRFFTTTADLVTRYGGHAIRLEATRLPAGVKLAIVPMLDVNSGRLLPIRDLASACRAAGTRLLVEATPGLAACELRLDAWQIDACVAGVDHGLGGAPGMALVSYSADIEALLHARQTPPRTSYLDLLQLQAYWSPERLNHHTAPTSLVYSLREALRLVVDEGLEARWQRHAQIGGLLQERLRALGLEVGGDVPFASVRLPAGAHAGAWRDRLVEDFGVHVRVTGPDTWRIGLLGAEARPDAVWRVLSAVEHLLAEAR